MIIGMANLRWKVFVRGLKAPIREVCKKSKWKFKMAFAIRGPDIFLPHFFSFAIESYIYETDFTLGLSQKYHF